MDDSLLLILFIVAVGGLGLVLLERTRRDPLRWRLLLQSSHPGVAVAPAASNPRGAFTFTLRGRQLELSTVPPHLVLATALPLTPLPWTQAARALGDGEMLAAILDPAVVLDTRTLSLRLPMSTVRARHLRGAIERILTLAERLEALPMAQALARHVLDFAPPDEREQAFDVLCQLYPEAEATRQCALACLDEEEHPGLVAKARGLLAARAEVDRGTKPH